MKKVQGTKFRSASELPNIQDAWIHVFALIQNTDRNLKMEVGIYQDIITHLCFKYMQL